VRLELMEMSGRRPGEQVLRPGLHFILEWGDGLGDVIIRTDGAKECASSIHLPPRRVAGALLEPKSDRLLVGNLARRNHPL
jgi:hypothetical protein